MNNYKIGYEQLTPPEKKAYGIFEKAFSSCAKSVDSSAINRSVDVMKVLQVALGDNPRVIYFNKTQIKVSSSLLGGKQIHFCGTYSSSQIRRMNQEIDKLVSSITEEILLLNPLSDYVRTADMVNRFMHSGDIGVFRDLKPATGSSSGIKEAGRIMKYCNYSEARMILPREFESIIFSLDDPYLKFFMEYMTEWVSEENESAFFRGMASMYASVENYIYAMMATYHALDLELKANNIDPNQSRKEKLNYWKNNYPYLQGKGKKKSKACPYLDFMHVFRSALVHKNSSGIGANNKDFYQNLKDCLEALGVETPPTKADVPASRMMVSFHKPTRG